LRSAQRRDLVNTDIWAQNTFIPRRFNDAQNLVNAAVTNDTQLDYWNLSRETNSPLVHGPEASMLRKFKTPKDPLAAEAKLKDISAPPQVAHAHKEQIYASMLANARTQEERLAIEIARRHEIDKSVSKQVDEHFATSFQNWILKRGRRQDHVNAGWWDINSTAVPKFLSSGGLLSSHPSVQKYVEGFILSRPQFEQKLLQLKIEAKTRGVEDWPIDKLYLYYKYVVRGLEIDDQDLFCPPVGPAPVAAAPAFVAPPTAVVPAAPAIVLPPAPPAPDPSDIIMPDVSSLPPPPPPHNPGHPPAPAPDSAPVSSLVPAQRGLFSTLYEAGVSFLRGQPGPSASDVQQPEPQELVADPEDDGDDDDAGDAHSPDMDSGSEEERSASESESEAEKSRKRTPARNSRSQPIVPPPSAEKGKQKMTPAEELAELRRQRQELANRPVLQMLEPMVAFEDRRDRVLHQVIADQAQHEADMEAVDVDDLQRFVDSNKVDLNLLHQRELNHALMEQEIREHYMSHFDTHRAEAAWLAEHKEINEMRMKHNLQIHAQKVINRKLQPTTQVTSAPQQYQPPRPPPRGPDTPVPSAPPRPIETPSPLRPPISLPPVAVVNTQPPMPPGMAEPTIEDQLEQLDAQITASHALYDKVPEKSKQAVLSNLEHLIKQREALAARQRQDPVAERRRDLPAAVAALERGARQAEEQARNTKRRAAPSLAPVTQELTQKLEVAQQLMNDPNFAQLVAERQAQQFAGDRPTPDTRPMAEQQAEARQRLEQRVEARIADVEREEAQAQDEYEALQAAAQARAQAQEEARIYRETHAKVRLERLADEVDRTAETMFYAANPQHRPSPYDESPLSSAMSGRRRGITGKKNVDWSDEESSTPVAAAPAPAQSSSSSSSSGLVPLSSADPIIIPRNTRRATEKERAMIREHIRANKAALEEQASLKHKQAKKGDPMLTEQDVEIQSTPMELRSRKVPEKPSARRAELNRIEEQIAELRTKKMSKLARDRILRDLLDKKASLTNINDAAYLVKKAKPRSGEDSD
jgi:hypothetical protein